MNERIGQRRGNPEGKRRNRQSLFQGNGSVTVFFACMQRSLFGKRSNPDVGNATCCVSGIFAGHDLARFDSISTGSRTGEGNRGPGSGFSAFLKQVFRPKIFFVKKKHFLMFLGERLIFATGHTGSETGPHGIPESPAGLRHLSMSGFLPGRFRQPKSERRHVRHLHGRNGR